jgi:hypothetical protein
MSRAVLNKYYNNEPESRVAKSAQQQVLRRQSKLPPAAPPREAQVSYTL